MRAGGNDISPSDHQYNLVKAGCAVVLTDSFRRNMGFGVECLGGVLQVPLQQVIINVGIQPASPTRAWQKLVKVTCRNYYESKEGSLLAL